MKLRFLGTRANTDVASPRHRRHSSALVSYHGWSIMIDCGAEVIRGKTTEPERVARQVTTMAAERGVRAELANDGMAMIVRGCRTSA